MKLIQKGRDQKTPAKELECTGKGNGGNGCGAILLVEETDVFATTSQARDETTHYTTFQCSECNDWTDIEGLRAKNPIKPCYTCCRIDCEHIQAD